MHAVQILGVRASVAIAPFLLGFFAMLLGGCTELEVRRVGTGEKIEGIPYTLPKKTFVVTVTYELRECRDGPAGPQVKAGKSVSVTPATLPDEKERFYIPYTTLRNWFKNTDITVESYENQTLKSVASTITDKTGDAITSVISSAIKLATFGGGVASAATQAAPAGPACNTEAAGALSALAELRKKDKPTEHEAATMAQLRAQLTHKEVLQWSPAKPDPMPDQTAGPLTLEIAIAPNGLVGVNGKWVTGVSEPISAELASAVQLTVHDKVAADAQVLPEGFVLRQGPSATLRVCDQSCPVGASAGTGAVRTEESRVLNTSVHVIPQFGRYVGMPLRNRVFETQTLTINLSAEGAITKLGLNSNAAGVAALQNFGTNLDALSKARDARDKAEAAAALAEQNAGKARADQVAKENNAIAECLRAQKTLRDAGGTVTGTCQ